MRYFLDTEFIEDGRTIDLISIGIVCDRNGSERFFQSNQLELYLCSTEARLDLAGSWVRENVVPRLPRSDAPEWRSPAEIRDAVARFISAGPKAELWGCVDDYG